MTYEQWLNAQPSAFPERIKPYADSTPLQNPIIGADQKQTCINVKQVVDFFLEMAYSSYTEPVNFSMGVSATSGFITILECLSGALEFEQKLRQDSREGDDQGKRQHEEDQL